MRTAYVYTRNTFTLLAQFNTARFVVFPNVHTTFDSAYLSLTLMCTQQLLYPSEVTGM